jgi:hypothetical protein
MGLICKFCGKDIGDGRAGIKHLLAECGIEGDRDEYWRSIVKLTFEEVIKDIAEGRLNIQDSNIDELRAAILLASMGLVKIPYLDLSPEEIQILILDTCPELILYAMEYVGLVEIEKGWVRLKEERDG